MNRLICFAPGSGSDEESFPPVAYLFRWRVSRELHLLWFRRSSDHSGIVWNCWTGALAHLGVARANALQARTSQGVDADAVRDRALAAYKDFLTLWKDAAPDNPHPEGSQR